MSADARTAGASASRDGAARGPDALVVGGASLIVAAIGFVGVFSWLAARFDYPRVLDGPAATVLPALLDTGTMGRAVWFAYAMLPLLLLPVAIATPARFGDHSPALARGGVLLLGVAIVSMLAGLLRWPTLHWALAEAWPSAGDSTRAAIAALFDGANRYLGNALGEFVGEFALNAWFLVVAIAGARDRQTPRWIVVGGVVAALLGLVALWRNVTPLVAPVADLENVVLPLWMIVTGARFVRDGVARPH
jgi:hypothetical protein